MNTLTRCQQLLCLYRPTGHHRVDVMGLTANVFMRSKWTIMKGALHRGHSLLTPGMSYMQRHNLHSIRNELAKFEGGSVDLDLDNKAGLAILTLNNPRRMNSMTGKMMVDLADCVSELTKWNHGKGLILKGQGGNFCTGGDLTFVKKALHYGGEMAAYQHDTLTRLLNLPLISVALVQGHTLGGGAELSTACDYRVMSSTAKIGFVQMKMGLTTAWGAATRLTRLLGRRKAINLLCSAKLLTARAALAEGLADYVIPESCDDELQETKHWLLTNICSLDTDVIQSIKRQVVLADLRSNSSYAP